jgi:archaellum component FlaF (FlaF/FlaG flagellin family)
MKKLFSRRPSVGTVIAFIALCVALGGGAYAATKKKIEYKGLSKDARLKVLPFSSTNANIGTTACDPTSASTYTDCTSVTVNGSTGFPRKYMVVFDGVFNSGATPPTDAAGECRLEVDNNALNGTTTRVRTPGPANGFGINIVTTPQGGQHEISVACNETAGDLRVPTYQLSAFQVR